MALSSSVLPALQTTTSTSRVETVAITRELIANAFIDKAEFSKSEVRFKTPR